MRATSCLHAALLAAALSVAAGVRSAEACSCIGGQTPCQAFASSPIVFVGEVVSVEKTGADFHMRLRVLRALKGTAEPIADLWSSAQTSCGVRLEEGVRYVVYTSDAGGRMTIDACSYGHQLAPGEPVPELPPVPGRVYGKVTRYDIDRIREFEPLEPMPSVRVNLDLPTGRVSAVTDQWGRFQFVDVPPGKHPLTADAGQGMTGDERGPLVMPADTCVATQMVLKPSGKLSGRVLTADGKPARNVYLRLVPDGPAGSDLHQHVELAQTTRPDGRFEIDGLGPDNYAVAVNPDGEDATGRHPYPPAWFGGKDRASAARIPIAAGAAVELDRPFVLPPALATRTYTVAVTCEDGSVPAAVGARAQASNGARFAEHDDTGDGPIRTLTLVRDLAYTLLVSIYVPNGPERPWRGLRHEETLAPIALPAGAAGRTFSLVAPFSRCSEQ